MRAARVVVLSGLSTLGACVEANVRASTMVSEYARYSGCPEEKIQLDDNAPDGHPRASGCGNSLSFRCNYEGVCKSAVIVVADRHAKQFSCTPKEADVEALGGDAYVAKGCGQTMTYQCFRDVEHTFRCFAETAERRSASE